LNGSTTDHEGAGRGDSRHYKTSAEDDEADDNDLDFADQIAHAPASDKRGIMRQAVGGDGLSLCRQAKSSSLP
jgi:hypothetical protein